jgi:hypothetical protein
MFSNRRNTARQATTKVIGDKRKVTGDSCMPTCPTEGESSQKTRIGTSSFQFFGPARYGRWLDSRRYRRRQPPNTVHSYPLQPALKAFGANSAV